MENDNKIQERLDELTARLERLELIYTDALLPGADDPDDIDDTITVRPEKTYVQY